MKIEQINSKGKRYYLIDEKIKLFSVTTLIDNVKDKTVLNSWQESVGIEKANFIRDESAKRGNEVHKYIEDFLLHKKLPSNEEDYHIYFEKMKPVLDRVEPLKIEEKTYWLDKKKEEEGFAGTVDFVGKTNLNKFEDCLGNKLEDKEVSFIGDWKTWNKSKYPVSKNRDNKKYYPLISYYLQLSAYCAAINQRDESDLKINNAFLFGVTHNCRQPFIYFLDSKHMMFYWNKMKEIVKCFYEKSFFDWHSFEEEAEELQLLGQRLKLAE